MWILVLHHAFMVLYSFILFFQHVRLINQNLTTNESMNGYRYAHDAANREPCSVHPPLRLYCMLRCV